jgi:LPPG:FO 2-phospho-L-lactate transferase
MTDDRSFVVLSGGVGGAKLVLGLSRLLPPANLVVIANTGDDFEHLGLPISPDIDTLIYTLADAVNNETGWGRNDETWNFMAALERLATSRPTFDARACSPAA